MRIRTYSIFCLIVSTFATSQTVGHWQQLTSQDVLSTSPTITVNTQLKSIAAGSANAAVAVGFSTNPNGPQYSETTLVEVCTAETCAIAPSPNIATDRNELNAVTAVPGSPNHYVAVGFYDSTNAAASGALAIESTDGGNSWKIVPIAFDGVSIDELFGVAAIDSNHIWLVGFHLGPPMTVTRRIGRKIVTTTVTPPIQVLLFLYDGNTVTRVASPTDSSTSNNQLFGVSCDAPSRACWAAGITGDSQFTPLALKLTPGTTQWAVVPPATTVNSFASSKFKAISVVGAQVCAVGLGQTYEGNSLPLIECLDSSGKFQQLFFAFSTQGTATIATELYGMSGAPGFFQAVGQTDGSPFILQGTSTAAGTGWNQTPAANLSSPDNFLVGIGAADTNNMFAAGQIIDSSTGQVYALIEKFTNP